MKLQRSESCPRPSLIGKMLLLIFMGVLSAAVLILPATGRATLQGGSVPDATHAPPPPTTRTDNVVDDYFGTKVTDPYRWLEDQNSPETRAWIDKENAYTDSTLTKLPGRETLHARLSQLLKVDSTGLPAERNGRYFFDKRLSDEDQPKIYYRQGVNGKDELLVDPLPMSKDHTTTVDLADISHDGALIVYNVRQGGADEVTPHAFDVDARRDLAEQFPKGLYFGMDITKDKSGVYYTIQTENGPRVYSHRMGTPFSEDHLIFGEGYGREKIIGSSISEDGRYLLLHVIYGSAADRTEVYFKDLAADGPVIPVVNDVIARFQASIAGGRIYIQTNMDAPMEKIVVADLAHPTKENWKTLVPESDSHIEGFSLAGGKVSVLYSHNASSQMRIFDSSGKPVRDITLPSIGTSTTLVGHWDSSESFYLFGSFFIPFRIYRYDLASGTQSIWAESKVPVAADQFTVEQVWFNSKDGTRVPMFVAHKKGLKLDGSNPALLTGYGGFNVSETPYFSSSAVTWMENGGVYADVNLRGGGEFGEKWHQAGMMEKKQNVFDDFIAAAEWLIANHYTNPSRLAARGASNGGLLMGAMATQRPDLFAGIICGFPLLDMLRYQNFLVGKYWVPEYGSSDNAEQFKYIYAYSPYQHVKPGTKYPGVLFVTGDSDTRVAPLHARKMAALMQADAAPGRPILLKYDTQSGHSGGASITKTVDDVTDELNFLLWQVGVTPKQRP